MTPPRVIVTRPEREAARWVALLAQRGLPAEALPLIRIEALPVSPALQQAWRDIDRYAALMFVSGNAVEAFFASNQASAHTGRAQAAIDLIANEGPRYMAPGPGTVAALREAGISDSRIDAPALDAGQFDSEALWAVVAGRPWQGRRVLIVRGQGAGAEMAGASNGRDWLARQLAAAGALPEFLAVYQRSAPLFTSQQRKTMADAAADGSVWLFSSSEAAGHLPAQDWSQARAVATHPRIAVAVRAVGWGVVAESRPAVDDIVASIESMQP
ncbi:MAG: uroporphyrinogen-III synthase [Polaromonas sp.]|uniref:uroporphyrinogen-III synthase n=1 Tax=Polaromonas sp. TaxID=1869339 RepID=UPI0027353BD5|nr:uroporphyrinogen-III synthase [Polaromonas sp.]MDP2818801.1 uroporphyrinogen-III synthase [Polaromonas sp.]